MNDINDDEEKRQNSAVRQKRSCLISESKSCEIGNVFQCNVFIFENNVFAKIRNGYKSLTIFVKKLHRRCLIWF